MRIVKQDIINRFKCLAGDCPCTCCSGWQIMVDEASLQRFEDYRGKLKDNVRASIDFEEGAILQCENGDCAFLNENRLCDLIIAEGEGMLCDTCRLYPRHVEEYEDLREWAMSLSCPEVARIMVEEEQDVEYLSEDNDEADPLEEEFEDFDLILFDKLLASREVMFSVLKKDFLSAGEKFGLIMELSERLQRLYDEGEEFEMDNVISQFSEDEFLKEKAEEYEVMFSGFVREDAGILTELELLSADWEQVLDTLDDYPFSEADSKWDFIEGVTKERHEKILNKLLESLIYTYYPGAIYNGMIFAYTQICLFCVIMTDSLALCKSEGEGRKITLEEYEEILYRLSRETEHSDDNINVLLEYFDAKLS